MPLWEMSFIITVSFIHKKNYVLLLSHIYNYFEKRYKWVWDLRTLAHFQGSETSPGLSQDFIDEYIKFLRLPSLLV